MCTIHVLVLESTDGQPRYLRRKRLLTPEAGKMQTTGKCVREALVAGSIPLHGGQAP